MQKIAAYLLERREGMNWPQARAEEVQKLKSSVTQWLLSKGAAALTSSGTYVSEDGSHATFAVEEATSGDRSWWMLRLEEVTTQGRRFVTAISVTNCTELVAVYASMEIGSDATAINHVEADPRCPKVIRSLLDLPGPWFHGKSKLTHLRSVEGFDAGEGLVAELKNPERTVPIIVVSDAGGVTLPEIHKRMAYDMTGIANVVTVDVEASWALTDGLGQALSCYGGAVRLYWPKLSLKDDPFRHPLWTRGRLTASELDLSVVTERFRRQLRGLVMRAAALGVVRPKEIDVIRMASSNAAFAEMKAKATSLQDYVELADSYAKENEELRKASEALDAQAAELQTRIAALESERAALLLRVENAEVQLKYKAPQAEEEIAPDSSADESQSDTEPSDGEVRFYKKLYAAPTHDVLLRVADCGCNAWEGSESAHKARKGVAKLEGGRTDWKKMQHCASCTGGGMWRVKW